MLVLRPFWLNVIEKAWLEKSIIWLMGVRWSGKMTLCKTLSDIEYFDCERPYVRQLLSNPEAFLESHRSKRLVLDEIHRLDDPSEILKIAADHYPDIKIIAIGSSTLGASAKFKDTLVGRKREIWLTPLLLAEMKSFGNEDKCHRFLYGGLPHFFEQNNLPEGDFRDWIDGYWAKDIQELFKVSKRNSFQKFAELLLMQSGGEFEASRLASACDVSRETINNYLAILEDTFAMHIVRPFSSHKSAEIVKAPKIYGFDTGFVCYAKGWRELRQEDHDFLWKHIILNEIQANLQTRGINYWRDKYGREVDFIVPERGENNAITAIECKFSITQHKLNKSSLALLSKNIQAFRRNYPVGQNFIVASDIEISFERQHDGITLTFVHPHDLVKKLRN